MNSRLANLWDKVRSGFWFVPSLMTLGAAVLAWLTLTVDGRLSPATGESWFWRGDAQGAREILTTVAGSMITVAGVTFSITIVALTLAASQFGPRLLRSFMRDTGNQMVLGTFVATFLYCLLVLRSVEQYGGSYHVPQVSVTVSLVLAVAGLGVLIYFVHHVAVSLQSEHLAASIAQEVGEVIDELFPEKLGSPAEPEPERKPQPVSRSEVCTVTAPGNGYLQTLDNEGLLALAEKHDLLLTLQTAPGEFVTRGTALLYAWPRERCPDAVSKQLAGQFLLGRHRTSTQDAKYPLQQLTVIAVRALSPGINDPFTAVTCIDWIGSGLTRLARRRIPSPFRKGGDGRIRVIAEPTTFAQMTDVTLNPIRQAGAAHVSVMLRLLETIERIAQVARREEDRDALRGHAGRVAEEVRESAHQERDKAAVEAFYRRVMEKLEKGAEPPREGPAPPSERD